MTDYLYSKDCLQTSKYIEITEQTKEERFDEFLRTINGAMESFASKRYSKETFAYIVSVACHNVADLYEADFSQIEDNKQNVDTLTILDEDKAYLNFEQTIKSSMACYQKAE